MNEHVDFCEAWEITHTTSNPLPDTPDPMDSSKTESSVSRGPS